MLGTRSYNFKPPTPILRATMHNVTDGRIDGQTDGTHDANSRS